MSNYHYAKKEYEPIDLIVGIHSILEAINNPNRKIIKLHTTQKGYESLRKLNKNKDITIEKKIYDLHEFQEKAKELYSNFDFEFRRIPSGALLEVENIPFMSESDFFEQHLKGMDELKIVCLDQITDVHNAAAIYRTCAFYNIDYIVLSVKHSFRFTPSFYRISSGGVEHIKTLTTSNLGKFVRKLKEKEIPVIALDESGEEMNFGERLKKFALILGQEDLGISHAVKFQCGKLYKLSAPGKIETLNVSIANSVALTKLLN